MGTKLDDDYFEEVEIPADLDCKTATQHREHYFKPLKEKTYTDCANAIIDFIVFPYLKKRDMVDIKYSDSEKW